MKSDMEERIERLERLVETQQKEIEELKNNLSKICKDLEWKIRTSSMPIDYNP